MLRCLRQRIRAKDASIAATGQLARAVLHPGIFARRRPALFSAQRAALSVATRSVKPHGACRVKSPFRLSQYTTLSTQLKELSSISLLQAEADTEATDASEQVTDENHHQISQSLEARSIQLKRQIGKQIALGIQDIVEVWRENEMELLVKRYRKMRIQHPIYAPVDREERLRQAAERTREKEKENSSIVDPYEDFSEWQEYLKGAELVDPVRLRRPKMPPRPTVRAAISHCLAILRVTRESDWKQIDKAFGDDEGLLHMNEYYTQATELSVEEVCVDIDNEDESQSEQESDDNEDDEDEVQEGDEEEGQEWVEEYSLDAIQNALDLVSSGEIVPDTEYYNFLIARAAVALDLSTDECLDTVVKITNHMKEETGTPQDCITSELLVRVVSTRLRSPHTALRFVNQLLKEPNLRNPDSLHAAFQLCMKVQDSKLALKLWECYIVQDQSVYFLPWSMIATFVDVLKSDFLQKETVDVLKFVLEQNFRTENRAVDKIFGRVCEWPLRNRDGSQDNLEILEAVCEMLSEETGYSPSMFVWTDLIRAASRHARNDERRIRIVYTATKVLLERFPDFRTDGALTESGLEACQKMDDRWLAVDLFARRVADVVYRLQSDEEMMLSHEVDFEPQENLMEADRETGTAYGGTGKQYGTKDEQKSENEQNASKNEQVALLSNRISSQEAIQVMNVCVESQCMDAVRAVLALAEKFQHAFHESLYPRLSSMAIHAFASHGDVESANESLRSCIVLGYKPKEEDYGAIIHGYIISGDKQIAEEMFRSLESGDSVRPGPTCYNAMILGCIQEGNWDKALSWYERMLDTDVEPLPASYSGLILASVKAGGRAQALEFLRQLVQREATVSRETIQLALRLFVPKLAGEEGLDNIRQRIRQMIDRQKSSPTGSLLALISAMKEGELEDAKPHGQSGEKWRAALSTIITVVEAKVDLTQSSGEKIILEGSSSPDNTNHYTL